MCRHTIIPSCSRSSSSSTVCVFHSCRCLGNQLTVMHMHTHTCAKRHKNRHRLDCRYRLYHTHKSILLSSPLAQCVSFDHALDTHTCILTQGCPAGVVCVCVCSVCPESVGNGSLYMCQVLNTSLSCLSERETMVKS